VTTWCVLLAVLASLVIYSIASGIERALSCTSRSRSSKDKDTDEDGTPGSERLPESRSPARHDDIL
jgi:hypothetical protein